MATTTKFTIKSPADIKADYLRVKRNGLIQRGVTNPQLGPGTDDDLTATALAAELSVLYANEQIQADNLMPDTATGASLVRAGAIYGLAMRSASGSGGNVTYSASAASFIAVGTQLIDAASLRYQVATGGSYANNASIPVTAIDTGTGTNHVAGDTLRWLTPPPFAAQAVTVATGGLTGAVDAEDQETFRTRLLSFLQNPPKGGNWAQVATYGDASSTSVQKTSVYPALNGPSTIHVACVGYISRNAQGLVTSMSRAIPAATMTGTIAPYIQGQFAEYAEVTVTATVDQATSMSIGLTLPSAPTASPPGPGGGWVDGTPWPAAVATTPTPYSATVTAVVNSTQFTVNATTAPVANVTHVAFLDPTNWTLYTGIVTAVAVVVANVTYQITIDTPWPNIAIGNYIWPACVNAQKYIDAILTAFSLMGPGEKTANAFILSRASRKPLPQNSWPYSLGATQLRYITSGNATLPANPEVIDVRFLNTTASTPTVPGAITSAPAVLTPANLGFYPI